MDPFLPPAGRVCLSLAALLGLLAGCDQNDAPDDAVQPPRAPEVARVVSADEAVANAVVATLDPATMNDAEIRQAVGAESHCAFRYTRSGRPVLAVRVQPDGPPLGGMLKLNGHLVSLEAPPADGPAGAADRFLLAAGPLRMTIMPDRAEGAGGPGAAAHREADMLFEIGESLRVGYRGYLDCASDPPPRSPR
ncbi:hypothetical protein QMO56_25855 [Roseomonas sp. E05]|uniref:DUF6692 family protein n=1 Tax=Roseomonas sp. E05 TaxID=3046310 RepID=UPI0024BABD83|nr:DUF6692 family protein [Roseomonas sp. E05]MDJ0391532.1 hypothetical protein [Roseomonas sp. E05]